MKKTRLLALFLAVLLTCVPVRAFAAPSDDIQKEIDALKEKEDELNRQADELQDQLDDNYATATSYAEEKERLDQETTLLLQQIDNTGDQIKEYNNLIAQRQAEVQSLQDDYLALTDRYAKRMRTMQETGDVTLWEVVFRAESFSDMLARSVMVEEVSRADREMMDEVRKSAQSVQDKKLELAQERGALEAKKLELAEEQDELAALRAKTDEILIHLNEEKQDIGQDLQSVEEMKDELVKQIAEQEVKYRAAVEKELEEKRRQEAENNGGTVPPSTGGFIFPLDRSGYAYMTSPYGYRVHPISGVYKLHNGADLAAYQGTKIYASRSGVVTTAAYNAGGYGNYVVINHGDGYSTLYGHMTHYCVSAGQYVSQGEVIGYVGSTGNSTGPHLHLTVYYNGNTINPLTVISLP